MAKSRIQIHITLSKDSAGIATFCMFMLLINIPTPLNLHQLHQLILLANTTTRSGPLGAGRRVFLQLLKAVVH